MASELRGSIGVGASRWLTGLAVHEIGEVAGPEFTASHKTEYFVPDQRPVIGLDRTQPGLPMKKGPAQTMTHDYKRNGCDHRSRAARKPLAK